MLRFDSRKLTIFTSWQRLTKQHLNVEIGLLHKSYRKVMGFSLLELLVSITILAVVALSFRDYSSYSYKKSILRSVVNDITSAIQFAKISAIVNGEYLLLTCLQESDCSRGMRLYAVILRTRGNSNKTFIPKVATNFCALDVRLQNLIYKCTLVREWYFKNSAYQISWHGFQSYNYLLFAPEVRNSTLNGKFLISEHDKIVTTLIVNRLGRVKKRAYEKLRGQGGFSF